MAGVDSNVPHKFPISLSREDVVNMFFASLVERMRSCGFGGAEEHVKHFFCSVCILL